MPSARLLSVAWLLTAACGDAPPEDGFASVGTLSTTTAATSASSSSEGSTGAASASGGSTGGAASSGEPLTSAGTSAADASSGGSGTATSQASTGGPDGGTVDASDFPSIQAAIDSLEGEGGAVYIPAGEHRIPEKLRVHSNITVFGAGMDVTILRFEDGAPVDHMIANDSSTGHENVAVRELTLQGPGPTDGINECCYGLKLERVTGALVTRVAARDHGRDGFYLGYKHVDGVPVGVVGARLSGIVAEGNGRNGLSIVQGQEIVVDGGTFAGNNTHELVAAIDLEPDPYPDGLVRAVRIVGNTVASNANNGVQLFAEGGAIVADNAVCYNTITDNAGTGIADTQADNDVFVGNTFSGNGAEADYDGSAKVGDEFAPACGLPLPDLPPLPPLP